MMDPTHSDCVRARKKFPVGVLLVNMIPSCREDHLCRHEVQKIGVIENKTHKTCYLDSLLQCLRSLGLITGLCADHAPQNTACPKLCFMCMLTQAFYDTRSPHMMVCSDTWEPMMSANGVHWNSQQDPVDILQALVVDNAWGSILQDCFLISLKHQYGVSFPCGHSSKIVRNILSVSAVLELVTCEVGGMLSDLINNEGSAPPPDWQRCWCGHRPTCDATSGMLATRAVFCVSLSRQILTVDYSTAPPRVISTSKSTASIHADSVLHCAGKKYHLRCLIQHLGEETSSGHYVATVILDDGSCVTYDDTLVTHCEYVGEEVWRTARLFAYEEFCSTRGEHESMSRSFTAAQTTLFEQPSENADVMDCTGDAHPVPGSPLAGPLYHWQVVQQRTPQ